MRVDKWLWAARFFKTRSLACAAADAGKILVNGSPAKPAKEIKPGDELEIRRDGLRWQLIVRGLSLQRSTAAQADMLYEESVESRSEREAAILERRLVKEPAAAIHGRPTKRARRRLQRLVG